MLAGARQDRPVRGDKFHPSRPLLDPFTHFACESSRQREGVGGEGGGGDDKV